MRVKLEVKITMIATLVIFAAYFLLLYAGVGLIQEKRFFASAPKETLAAVPEQKAERFRGAHLLGWGLAVLAILMFLGAIVLAAWDGMREQFGFWQFFARFLTMLYGMELYDILFFDWVLLCHSDFFPHFYPEVKGTVGPWQFGYNKKTHLVHFGIYVPICAAAAWICMML